MAFRRQYWVRIDEDHKRVVEIEGPHDPHIRVPEGISVAEILETYTLDGTDSKPGNADTRVVATYIFAADQASYEHLADIGFMPQEKPDGLRYEDIFVTTPHRPHYWLPPGGAIILTAYPQMKERKREEHRQTAKAAM